MANKNQTTPQASFSFDALMRALRYMLKNYGALFYFVVVCIAVSAYAINRSMLFTQVLIDNYIEPMLTSGSTDFSGLAGEIARLAFLLVVGILASYGFNRAHGHHRPGHYEETDKLGAGPNLSPERDGERVARKLGGKLHAHGARKVGRDGQPQAAALGTASGIGLVEAVEQPVRIDSGRVFHGVGYAQEDPTVF